MPIKLPLQFPVNSLNAMRLLTVVKKESPKHVEPLSRSLWLRYWSNVTFHVSCLNIQQQDITQADSLEEACISAGASYLTSSKNLTY